VFATTVHVPVDVSVNTIRASLLPRTGVVVLGGRHVVRVERHEVAVE
jgi:hypothetical protein